MLATRLLKIKVKFLINWEKNRVHPDGDKSDYDRLLVISQKREEAVILLLQ